MERKKTEIVELPELELEILKLCLFTESFESICEECTSTKDANIVADAIKNLIHQKMMIAENLEASSLSWIYDSDKMSQSKFRTTSKGLDFIGL